MRPISHLKQITKSSSEPTLRNMKFKASSDDLISGLSDESLKALNHSISDTSLNEIVSQYSKGDTDGECFIRYGIDFIGEMYQCWTDTGDGKTNVHTLEFVKILCRFGCRYVFTIIGHRIWEYVNLTYKGLEPRLYEIIHKIFETPSPF